MKLPMTGFFASARPVLPEPQVIVGGMPFAGPASAAAPSGDAASARGKRNGG